MCQFVCVQQNGCHCDCSCWFGIPVNRTETTKHIHIALECVWKWNRNKKRKTKCDLCFLFCLSLNLEALCCRCFSQLNHIFPACAHFGTSFSLLLCQFIQFNFCNCNLAVIFSPSVLNRRAQSAFLRRVRKYVSKCTIEWMCVCDPKNGKKVDAQRMKSHIVSDSHSLAHIFRSSVCASIFPFCGTLVQLNWTLFRFL